MKTNLFFKLFGVMVVIVILPLAVVGYRTHQLLSTQLTAQIEENLSTRAAELTNYIDNWANMNLRMVLQNASLDAITSMNPARQTPILKSITKAYEQWVSIIITADVTGKSVARSDDEAPKNYADRLWFQEAISGKVSSDLIVSRTLGKPSWALAVPIYSAEKKVVGTLSMLSFISNISDIVGASKIDKTGFSFVISDKGRVVVHHRKELTQGMADFSRHPVLAQLGKEEKKKVVFVDDETNKQTVAYGQRTKFNWVVVVQQDYDEAYAPLSTAKRKTLILLAITLGIVALFSWFMAQRLSLKSGSTQKIDLFPRMASVAAVLIAVTLGAHWAIQHYSLSQRLTQYTEQYLSARNDALTHFVDMWIDMNLKMLRQNASLDEIKSMNPKKQKQVLTSIVKEYNWLFLAHTVGLNGTNVERSDSEKPKLLGDREWFKKPIAGAPFGSQIVLSRTTGNPTWALAVPIMDNHQKVIGVFGLASQLSDLSETITKFNFGKTGSAYLLTDSGQLVAHQKKAFTQALLDFSKFPPYMSLAKADKNKVVFDEENSGKHLVSYAQRSKYGWAVVVQRELDDNRTTIIEMNRNNLVILFISLFLAFAISYYFTRHLTKSDKI